MVWMTVREWMSSHKMKSLGVPRFIATGSHDRDGSQYRFMVMERFGTDLQKLFEQSGKRFPTSTVFLLGLKLVRLITCIVYWMAIHLENLECQRLRE